MPKISRNTLIISILISFIFIASLLGTSSNTSNELGQMKKLYVPNDLISKGTYLAYYLMVLFFLLTGIFKTKKTLKIPKAYFPLISAYFILLAWSFVTSSEHARYLTLFLCIIFCPIGLLNYLNKINFNQLSNYLIFILSILLVTATIYSVLNFPTHSRISGFHVNPNLMGMWLASVFALILYFSNHIKKTILIILSITIIILIIFTGSRLSLGMFAVLSLPFIWKYKTLTLISLPLILFILYITTGDPNLEFRAMNINNSISDSGRNIIWERALECIFSEPVVGHGMLAAEECVKTDNVHNSYLRITSMLGIPLTILFFSLYFYIIARSLYLPINPAIKFYLLSLILAFFAEDYIVGISSPFFPFFILMLTLLLFDLNKSNKKENNP